MTTHYLDPMLHQQNDDLNEVIHVFFFSMFDLLMNVRYNNIIFIHIYNYKVILVRQKTYKKEDMSRSNS